MSLLSKTILAKDVIGQAQELAAVEDARLLIKKLGQTYYNMAVAEIYNMMSHLDPETFTVTENITSTGTLPNQEIDLTTLTQPFDKIEAVDFSIDSTQYDCFGLRAPEFLRHKRYVKAQHPYEDSIVFSERDQKLYFITGENVPTTGTVAIDLIFKRQYVVLTDANYDTTYLDLPDKFISVAITRIASYAEVRQGISDKALASVKMSYDSLLANTEAEYKNNIMKSLQYNTSYAPEENPQQKGYMSR